MRTGIGVGLLRRLVHLGAEARHDAGADEQAGKVGFERTGGLATAATPLTRKGTASAMFWLSRASGAMTNSKPSVLRLR